MAILSCEQTQTTLAVVRRLTRQKSGVKASTSVGDKAGVCIRQQATRLTPKIVSAKWGLIRAGITARLPAAFAAAAILLTMRAVLQMHPKNEWRLNHTYLTLSFLASAAFLVLGNLLFLWKPTHRAGQVLVDRVVGMVDNWENETLRSFIELGIWLGVRGP
eukprot:6175181-Pleurochrysis_carterae.AAC.8